MYVCMYVWDLSPLPERRARHKQASHRQCTHAPVSSVGDWQALRSEINEAKLGADSAALPQQLVAAEQTAGSSRAGSRQQQRRQPAAARADRQSWQRQPPPPPAAAAGAAAEPDSNSPFFWGVFFFFFFFVSLFPVPSLSALRSSLSALFSVSAFCSLPSVFASPVFPCFSRLLKTILPSHVPVLRAGCLPMAVTDLPTDLHSIRSYSDYLAGRPTKPYPTLPKPNNPIHPRAP